MPLALVAMWQALREPAREQMADILRSKLRTKPTDITQTLLNLVETAELFEVNVGVDGEPRWGSRGERRVGTLGVLGLAADHARTAAKALRWSEMEFQRDPCEERLGALIKAINQTDQRDSSRGLLVYACRELGIKLREEWYAHVGMWRRAWVGLQEREAQAARGKEEFINAVKNRLAEEQPEVDEEKADDDAEWEWENRRINCALESMQCLSKLCEWRELYRIAEEKWSQYEDVRDNDEPETVADAFRCPRSRCVDAFQ